MPVLRVGTSLRVVMTSSTMPYSLACAAVRMVSRSMSARTFSTVWPVCWARISSSRARMRRISLAWISRSVTWPWPSPEGWWIRMRAFCSANRLPLVPAASSTAAAEAAWPMQIVWISGRTYCSVS